ncbi:MAG: hypothetical protein E6K46_08975 [Gammaproteobacteria bacterium]|nr:MAG: hypothetical protein E6K46_08975 [Gammaproteobacteria bacterium]
MDAITLLTVAVLVGWLATLILLGKNEDVYVCDFSIAVAGAALAGGLIAPSLGISPTGEYGLSLSCTLISWAGATALLAAANLLRYGRLRGDRRRSTRKGATAQPLAHPGKD